MANPESIPDVNTALLDCGVVLAYEAATFVPLVGDLVPCRHHGYCPVHASHPFDNPRERAERSRRRSLDELVEWRSGRSMTTLSELGHRRYRLRLVAVAERQGHVAVDYVTGRVTVNPGLLHG